MLAVVPTANVATGSREGETRPSADEVDVEAGLAEARELRENACNKSAEDQELHVVQAKLLLRLDNCLAFIPIS